MDIANEPRYPRQHDCRTGSDISTKSSCDKYDTSQYANSGPMTKRKRSSSSDIDRAFKKTILDSYSTRSNICPLLRVVQQYGLLLGIVLNLSPEDLLALALLSKDFYRALAPRPQSLQNLLGRMSCPGRGIRIRQERHQLFDPSQYNQYLRCASMSPGRGIETRPCSRCKVNTCDECRIHCVYQSVYEKPCEDDELPNFSGFVMLDAWEVPILSPRHLDPDGPSWQEPSRNECGPYHDLGFIDVPFHDPEYGTPEDVEQILNLDLGLNSLAASAASNVSSPSPVLRALHNVALQRRQWFCKTCLITEADGDALTTTCHCTLKGRYLDPWVCLRCYQAEERLMAMMAHKDGSKCGCAHQRAQATCTWCWGIITGPDGL
ncbi:hypothetical protein NX059_000661 [Plenodomus lindquistii]|nr:hypothetical protein NX059_000661 [Plenodomus lindquistii]